MRQFHINYIHIHICLNSIIHFYKPKIFNFIFFRPFLVLLASLPHAVRSYISLRVAVIVLINSYTFIGNLRCRLLCSLSSLIRWRLGFFSKLTSSSRCPALAQPWWQHFMAWPHLSICFDDLWLP